MSIAVTPTTTTTTLNAKDIYYTIKQNTALTIGPPGVLAYVTPQVSGLSAVFIGGPQHGALSSMPNGSFVYTPGVNYTGTDSFQYQAQAGGMQSNVAIVHITIMPSSISLLPNTPYFNYVRRRWSIDPARFDYWHPKIGALIGLEIYGFPTKPTEIVSRNAHFNAAADRAARGEPATVRPAASGSRRPVPARDSGAGG